METPAVVLRLLLAGCACAVATVTACVDSRHAEAAGEPPRAAELERSGTEGAATGPVKNVVLLIGDGMGINQLSLAHIQKGRLALARMEHLGLSFTHSLLDSVTDSAASATALATGYRVINGQVGVFPDGRAVKTVLEHAEERGQWTGIVATSRITHATPASMATHVDSRGKEDEIAVQLAEAEIEVILGGGWDKFLPRRRAHVLVPQKARPRVFAASLERPSRGTLAAQPGVGMDGKPFGSRSDRRNLIEEMEERGYRFVRTSSELFMAAENPPERLIGLFSSGPMPKASEGRAPALSAMALAALRLLSRSPEGFFLMIEGSQIDWGGHANDADYVMNEATDFDNAIEAVLAFVEERGIANETLIVVTADHETGGLTLNKHPHLRWGLAPRWTSDYHTAAAVPVFASGPMSRRLGGLTDHARIGRVLIEAVTGRPFREAGGEVGD